MRRRWLIILLAALLLALSRLIWQQLQPEPVEISPGSSRFAYRINDLVLTILDPDGKEQVTIRSPLLTDAGEGQPSELSEPVITAPDDQGTWQLTAQLALIDRHNEQVTLLENVVLQSLNQARSIRVETSQAQLDIKTKALSSPEIVTITQSGARLQGRGLSGNLEQQTYVLHNDVQAQFIDRQAQSN